MSWVYKAKMDTVSKEPAGWQEGRLRHPAETVPGTIWKIREPWDSSLLTHREDTVVGWKEEAGSGPHGGGGGPSLNELPTDPESRAPFSAHPQAPLGSHAMWDSPRSEVQGHSFSPPFPPSLNLLKQHGPQEERARGAS